jgi:hypothetical protein
MLYIILNIVLSLLLFRISTTAFQIKSSFKDILFLIPALMIMFLLSTLLSYGIPGIKLYFIICGIFTLISFYPYKDFRKTDLFVLFFNIFVLPASIFGFLLSWYLDLKQEIKNV